MFDVERHQSQGIEDNIFSFQWCLRRVQVGLSESHSEKFAGGAAFTMLVGKDYSRMTFIFFLKTKDGATENFSKFLADHNRRLHWVRCVKSDNETEFRCAAFRQICDTNGTRQEIAAPGTPEKNRVTERELGLIAETSQASTMEAHLVFPNHQLPAQRRLWGEACFFNSDAFNRSAISAEPGCLSPYELFYKE